MKPSTGNELFEQIYSLSNLYYAWKKIQNVYRKEADFLTRADELAEFEANLEENLSEISSQIKTGSYRLDPVIPLCLPKEADPPESRQHFDFSVRDQVTWMAVINCIGPRLDNSMPFWSFGNRLYMPIWKENDPASTEEDDPKKVTRFGRYTASSPKIYRNWSVSWPLFRKAVSISVKTMLRSEYNADEKEEIETYKQAPSAFKIGYWETSYWKEPHGNEAYYAAIDLKKFYPSINRSQVLNGCVKEILEISDASGHPLERLINTLLDFRIPKKYLKKIAAGAEKGINKKTGEFDRIPTGLFVAGFLSNIAMLPIDREVDEILRSRGKIGQFRFVDDHVFIAYDFAELSRWIAQYEAILEKHLPDASINKEKIEPEAFKEYYCLLGNDSAIPEEEKNNKRNRAIEACKLDPLLPVPFTTLTIQKFSTINSRPFDLLDEAEKNELLRDIEHLLVTNFPDEEIRKDTRVSWAASILTRLAPVIDYDVKELYEKRRALEKAHSQLQKADNDQGVTDKEKLLGNATAAKVNYSEAKDRARRELENTYEHIFLLLLKALKGNLAKPKLWKKCVHYCFVTGHDGLPRIFDVLENAQTLTEPGKVYLFSTVIAAITEDVIASIRIFRSNSYTWKEKESANSFIEALSVFRDKITSMEKESFHSEHSQNVLCQLDFALSLRKLECGTGKLKSRLSRYKIRLLWHYLPSVISHGEEGDVPAVFDLLIKEFSSRSQDQVLRKLLRMYPQKLEKIRELVFPKDMGLSPDISDESEDSDTISLQALFMGDASDASKDHCEPIYRSEWAALKLVSKIINALQQALEQPRIISEESIRSLGNEQDFYNCAPCNWRINKKIKDQKTWKELQTFLDASSVIKNPKAEDYRFDCSFYNNFDSLVAHKRQVYSCAVLLIALLSHSQEFDPMIGRSSKYDRSYRQLIAKLRLLPVSSYTQAILIGALTDQRFELKNYSSLDVMGEGRTEERRDAPVIVESLEDFGFHLEKAMDLLERLQLSLQDHKCRQMVPVSLKLLTKESNPNNENGDTEDGI